MEPWRQTKNAFPPPSRGENAFLVVLCSGVGQGFLPQMTLFHGW